MSRHSVLRTVLAAALVTGVVSAGVWIFRARTERIREIRLVMGTTVQVDVCRYSDRDSVRLEGAYAEIWRRMDEINQRMSSYKPDSDVSRVNRSFPNPVKVHEDTYHVIQQSLEVNRLTQGAFDITVRPLILLWRQAQKDQVVPDPLRLQQAEEAVGPDRLRLEGDGVVRTLHPLTQIDLGGIAKGYAVDETARILRSRGFEDFLIDAGGDLYAGGHNCRHQPWKIGIRNPRRPRELIDTVIVENKAVTTSGDYERGFQIGDRHYSHIFDPRSGTNRLPVISSSVIADTAAMADALSTALSVLDPQEGLRVAEALDPPAEVLLVQQDPKGALRFLSSRGSRFSVDVLQK